MPYTRKKREPELTRLLRAEHLTMEEIGEAIGASRQTASRKVKNPDLFTIGELKNICRKLHIPMDEIRETIKL